MSKSMLMTSGSARASALVFALALASPAYGQSVESGAAPPDASGEEEIIVTAQRRAERTEDVPISITSIDSETLDRANIQQLSDIPKVTPALRFDYQGPFVQPTIRGIGTAVVTTGSGSNVGLYVDGFYVANPVASDFQLLSVENIQVLKGPQGTLFGRNTTGGAILVTTSKPSEDTRGVVDASYGSFNAKRLEGYATTGLAKGVAADLGAQYSKGDGFIRNIVTGSKKDGRYEKWSVRAGLKVDLSDNISVLLRYQHQDNDDPYPMLNSNLLDTQIGGIQNPAGLPASTATFIPGGVVATRPGEVSITDPVFARSNNDTYQLTTTFDFNFATLTSYTQYRDEQSIFQQNFTAATPGLLILYVPIHDRTFTQELLLSSKPGGRLQWTAGAFYMTYRDRFRAFFGDGVQIAGSNTDTRTLAFFVDGTYEVIDNLFVTAGARYSHDTVRDAFFETGTPTGLVRTDAPFLKANRVTPRLVLRYEAAPRSSIYASFTRGYKAAMYNLGGQSTELIRPESLNAIEVGFKRGGSDFSFEAAAFYYDYKDLQVASYAPVNGIPAGIVSNAAAARIYGLETQVHYKPTRNLELNASGAYVNAKYKHFFNDPFFQPCFSFPLATGCTVADFATLVVVPIPDAQDFSMQRAPKFAGNLGVRYSRDLRGGEVALSGNLYYTSSFFFDSAEQVKQDGFATLSLRVEWTDPSDRFTVAFYGDNVTDKRYLTQGGLRTTASPVTWSPPATWGAEVRFRFR